MESHIKLGRVFGFEIGLHYTWIIIALLITFSLARHFQATNPAWGGGVIWGLAIITGIFFFASIIVHELSHAVVARMRGLPVRSITLFALGGVARVEKEAADAKTEFWVGVVGPITSALIGFVCLAPAWALGSRGGTEADTPLLAMLVWLGYINVGLAIFNLIPGFPMDGGRVLRAIVWWKTGDEAFATRVASRIGQTIAFGFIVLGVVGLFGGLGFGGLWITFIGWFLFSAARASYARVEMNERLRGVRVGDVMARDCPVVDGRSNLQTFVNEHLLRTGRRCFLIDENGKTVGLITPHEIKGIERARWPYTTLDEVMIPIDRLKSVDPDALVTEALEIIGRADVNQLPVVADGRLEGVISRDRVLQFLVTRTELEM